MKSFGAGSLRQHLQRRLSSEREWYHMTLVLLFLLHLRVQFSLACSKWTSPSSCLTPRPSAVLSSSPQYLPPDPCPSASCCRRSGALEAQQGSKQSPMTRTYLSEASLPPPLHPPPWRTKNVYGVGTLLLSFVEAPRGICMCSPE